MAQLAGFELESRHADWAGAEFTADSPVARVGLPAARLEPRAGGRLGRMPEDRDDRPRT